jgi:hypothetical protein
MIMNGKDLEGGSRGLFSETISEFACVKAKVKHDTLRTGGSADEIQRHTSLIQVSKARCRSHCIVSYNAAILIMQTQYSHP